MLGTLRWEASLPETSWVYDVRSSRLGSSPSLSSLTCFTVRSAPAVLGYGTALAAILYAFTYTGGRFTGYQRDPDVDEVSRKEYLRKNRRRDIEETVHNLGEGRGTRTEHGLMSIL